MKIMKILIIIKIVVVVVVDSYSNSNGIELKKYLVKVVSSVQT